MKPTDVRQSFLASMPLSMLALLIAIGYKVWAAALIDREVLGLFFTTLDIFALSLLVLVGFRSSMVVAYARTHQDRKILNIFRIILMVAVLGSWALVIPYLKHRMGVEVDYWYLVAALLGTALWTYLGNQLAMYRLYSIINKATFLEPVLVVGWFALAWYGFGVRGMQALFIGAVMGTLSLSLYLLIAKYRHHLSEPPMRFEAMDDDMKQFVRNSVISTVEFGSGIVMIYLAVIFLLHYHGAEELGNFQVVVKPIFMGLIAIFVFPVFRFFLPELSHLVKAKAWGQIEALRHWYIRFSTLMGLLVISLFFFFGREMIDWLFPQHYALAYLMLAHLVFFFPFIMLNAFQLALIKASGFFVPALLVRVSGIMIFGVSFYVLRFFSQSVIDVVMGLSIGYLGMFMISWLMEKRLIGRLKVEG